VAISSKDNTIFTRLSLILSSVCIIHCLSVPFVIIAMPFFAAFFTETIELVLVLAILPLGLAGFLPVWYKHKNYRLLIYFAASISLILIAQFAFHTSHEIYSTAGFWNFSHFIEISLKPFLTFIGAIGLAWTTYQNNYHTHVCTNKNHVHE